MNSPQTNESLLFDVLRENIGGWYEKQYGERLSNKKMIEFYASGTEYRIANLLGSLAPKFKENNPQNVLDVGCGFASIAIYLAWQWPGSTIIATDRFDNYYSYGQSAARQLNLENIQFKTEAISSLSSEEEYDLIICSNVLNYMATYELLKDCLTRLAAAVEKKGYLIIHTPHYWSWIEPFTKIPLLQHLPRKHQNLIAKQSGRRSSLSDVRHPSLREISSILLKSDMHLIDVMPVNVFMQIKSTHITARYQKR